MDHGLFPNTTIDVSIIRRIKYPPTTQKKWLAGNSYFFSFVKSSRKNGWLERHIFSEKSSLPEKMVGWKVIFFLIRHVTQKKWLAGNSYFFSFVKSSRKNGWLESHIFSEKSSLPEKMVGQPTVIFSGVVDHLSEKMVEKKWLAECPLPKQCSKHRQKIDSGFHTALSLSSYK